MIHIILSILKIIGIIILVLLGIVLTLLLLVLLVPIRYQAGVGINEKPAVAELLALESPPPADVRLHAVAGWLFGLVRVTADFAEKKFSYKVKAACFSILDSEAPQKKKKADKKKNEKSKKGNTTVKKSEAKAFSQEKPDTPDTDRTEDVMTKASVESAKTSTTASTQTNHQARSDSEKKRDNIEKTDDRFLASGKKKSFQKPQMPDVEGIMEDITQKLDKASAMINDQDNRDFVVFVLKHLKKLLLHIRPQKHQITLFFGAADPSVTGQVYGAYCVVNSIFDMNFSFQPEFNKELLKLLARLSGRIRVINLLIIAIKVYFNKTFKKILGGLK